jgi:hypothetical protein
VTYKGWDGLGGGQRLHLIGGLKSADDEGKLVGLWNAFIFFN